MYPTVYTSLYFILHLSIKDKAKMGGYTLADARILYQTTLINHYNKLVDTLWDGQHNDMLLANQAITADLREKGQSMGATAFYEYAIPILENLLS